MAARRARPGSQWSPRIHFLGKAWSGTPLRRNGDDGRPRPARASTDAAFMGASSLRAKKCAAPFALLATGAAPKPKL